MSDLNKIIASILGSSEAQQLNGGETAPEVTGGRRSPRKLPMKLKRWNHALQTARHELGVVGFLAPKKSAGARSPQRKLYEAAKHYYNGGSLRKRGPY